MLLSCRGFFFLFSLLLFDILFFSFLYLFVLFNFSFRTWFYFEHLVDDNFIVIFFFGSFRSIVFFYWFIRIQLLLPIAHNIKLASSFLIHNTSDLFMCAPHSVRHRHKPLCFPFPLKHLFPCELHDFQNPMHKFHLI